MAELAAVLWDMDGTLVDTEPAWMETETELVESYGGTWTREDALNLVGNDLLVSGRYIAEHAGVPLEPAEIVELLLDGVIARVREDVPWRPGARELLADLGEHGIRCGLVTMSYRSFAAPVIAGLPGGTFEVVVTGDMVSRGKPDPEPYLTAAAMLGVSPGQALAIEDSNTGATSAEAAGMVVLAVPNHVPVLGGPRRVFVASLTGLHHEDLVRIHAEGSS